MGKKIDKECVHLSLLVSVESAIFINYVSYKKY
jgi:hypothetical protein